jgi:signal transduction histidine kinase
MNMMKTEITPFAQQYQEALRVHLGEPSLDHGPSNAARILGREAVECGMGVLDIARIHDQAMLVITGESSADASHPPDQPSAGGTFLLESLAAVEVQNEQTHQATSEALKRGEQQLAEKSVRYDELLAESRLLQAQSQQLAHKILLAQEEERKEISRELHDEVAQILAGVNVRLAALRKIGVLGHQSLEQSILQTQQLVEQSVDTVHRFARKLRPAMLDDLGLIPALRSFIKELPRPKALKIRFKVVDEVEELDNMRRTVFYRVAQEALLNVVHHADATYATVELLTIPGGIRLVVHDDGKAFRVDDVFYSKNCGRLGLIGMKERVDMVGGKFFIESTLETGTTIRADIPFLINFEENNS